LVLQRFPGFGFGHKITILNEVTSKLRQSAGPLRETGDPFFFSTCVAGIILLPSIGFDLLDEATREITTTGRNYLMSADMTKAHAAYQDFLSL
jgi:hypothetical protein